ncbi:MAG: hypothetical protein Q9169_002886 [Polycauliona sp. 2 TL-2023]
MSATHPVFALLLHHTNLELYLYRDRVKLSQDLTQHGTVPVRLMVTLLREVPPSSHLTQMTFAWLLYSRLWKEMKPSNPSLEPLEGIVVRGSRLWTGNLTNDSADIRHRVTQIYQLSITSAIGHGLVCRADNDSEAVRSI